LFDGGVMFFQDDGRPASGVGFALTVGAAEPGQYDRRPSRQSDEASGRRPTDSVEPRKTDGALGADGAGEDGRAAAGANGLEGDAAAGVAATFGSSDSSRKMTIARADIPAVRRRWRRESTVRRPARVKEPGTGETVPGRG
jgi:hypothetical protein